MASRSRKRKCSRRSAEEVLELIRADRYDALERGDDVRLCMCVLGQKYSRVRGDDSVDEKALTRTLALISSFPEEARIVWTYLGLVDDENVRNRLTTQMLHRIAASIRRESLCGRGKGCPESGGSIFSSHGVTTLGYALPVILQDFPHIVQLTTILQALFLGFKRSEDETLRFFKYLVHGVPRRLNDIVRVLSQLCENASNSGAAVRCLHYVADLSEVDARLVRDALRDAQTLPKLVFAITLKRSDALAYIDDSALKDTFLWSQTRSASVRGDRSSIDVMLSLCIDACETIMRMVTLSERGDGGSPSDTGLTRTLRILCRYLTSVAWRDVCNASSDGRKCVLMFEQLSVCIERLLSQRHYFRDAKCGTACLGVIVTVAQWLDCFSPRARQTFERSTCDAILRDDTVSIVRLKLYLLDVVRQDPTLVIQTVGRWIDAVLLPPQAPSAAILRAFFRDVVASAMRRCRDLISIDVARVAKFQTHANVDAICLVATHLEHATAANDPVRSALRNCGIFAYFVENGGAEQGDVAATLEWTICLIRCAQQFGAVAAEPIMSVVRATGECIARSNFSGNALERVFEALRACCDESGCNELTEARAALMLLLATESMRSCDRDTRSRYDGLVREMMVLAIAISPTSRHRSPETARTGVGSYGMLLDKLLHKREDAKRLVLAATRLRSALTDVGARCIASSSSSSPSFSPSQRRNVSLKDHCRNICEIAQRVSNARTSTECFSALREHLMNATKLFPRRATSPSYAEGILSTLAAISRRALLNLDTQVEDETTESNETATTVLLEHEWLRLSLARHLSPRWMRRTIARVLVASKGTSDGDDGDDATFARARYLFERRTPPTFLCARRSIGTAVLRVVCDSLRFLLVTRDSSGRDETRELTASLLGLALRDGARDSVLRSICFDFVRRVAEDASQGSVAFLRRLISLVSSDTSLQDAFFCENESKDLYRSGCVCNSGAVRIAKLCQGAAGMCEGIPDIVDAALVTVLESTSNSRSTASLTLALCARISETACSNARTIVNVRLLERALAMWVDAFRIRALSSQNVPCSRSDMCISVFGAHLMCAFEEFACQSASLARSVDSKLQGLLKETAVFRGASALRDYVASTRARIAYKSLGNSSTRGC